MTVALWPLLLAARVVQSPAADSLRLLAPQMSESALVAETRARPLVTREALGQALAQAVKGRAESRTDALVAARRLAGAYALAWRDSFLVREVTRFSTWPADRRIAKVWVDSVRRAGVTAYSRSGPRAAIAIWRRALARAVEIGDSVATAAVLGNIGAGLWREARLDSAERYLERARRLAASVGDTRVEANALGTLASVSADRGDLATARERHALALGLRERIGDSRGVASDHNNLGVLAQTAGDMEEARRRFEAALDVNRRDGRDEVAATNLVNLAGLASLTGDFARAEALYREALSTWRARAMWADAADALRGLGELELRRGDYPAARTTFREALAIFDRTGPLADALAVRGELATAAAAAGDLQAGVDELRRAQKLADSSRQLAGVRAGIALARADLAAQLNDLADADRLYARAQLLFRQAGDAGGEAEAQQGRGALFLARDDYARAQTFLDNARRMQLSAGNLRGASLTRLALGQLALARRDTIRARQHTARAATELERLGDPVATAAALGERASVEAALALPATAESLYHAALERIGGRVAPDVTWRLHAGLALARRAQGFADDATREFRAALTDIERSSRSLVVAERRSSFLLDKWEVYAQLALTERARGRAGAAFEASERLRAREMLELLARGRIGTPHDTAAELVAREQDLRRHIAQLTRDLEGATAGTEAMRGPTVSRAAASTREALARTQDAYADLRAELRDQAPRHEGLVSEKTVTWRDVARRLAPNEAFVEYLVSDSGSVAFVVVRDTVVALDLGAVRRDLARSVDFARGTLESRGRLDDSLWRAPLRRLHRYLIAPVEESGLLAGKTRLVLVPHAELHYLPFAALLDAEDRFVVERYELAVAPSGSVWVALTDRALSRRGDGFLAFAPRPDLLPASRREVAAVGRLPIPGTHVLVGGAATEEAFRRDAPSRRVIHLATYGVLNKHNPLFSFVELAAGGGHDGRLEVHEVFGLRLTADLVILSACQTGLASGALADVPAGDDWVGLTRAFLHAGAARVVATLWLVEDWATATLMERFYGAYASDGDAAHALAAAQRTLLAAPATAHPFYWAGFVLVGSGNAPR